MVEAAKSSVKNVTGNASKTIKTKIIELTEDRALCGRMAIISKNRSEFDL